MLVWGVSGCGCGCVCGSVFGFGRGVVGVDF